MTLSSNNSASSSSKATPPPLHQFTLEELIAVLQNHRIKVISPHQQMEREVEEQREIKRILEAERAEAASVTGSATVVNEPPAHAPVPAPTDAEASASSSAATDCEAPVREGSWTLFHTDNVPFAIMTGGSSHLTSPIPTSFIDELLAGLIQARINNGDGEGASASVVDCKGKAKEEDDYNLIPPPTTDITGFVCAKCKAHNLVRPSTDSWYVVTIGREVGVFSGWPTVQPLVIGVSGSCYKKYKSEADARAAFELASAAGNVHVVP